MDNITIKIDNLTKVYELYEKPQDRLKEALHPLKKKYHHDFYAVRDISLTISRGETVGIVGKNGAGKSTLLKIITGVLTQTSGSIYTEGKIASLLELGAGFNPEMTGIENIYLNGTIMGYSKEEMDSRLDAIIKFADIGEFIYQPVKMYSSGMFARLAFSVSIAVEPDILIVDEALSVGDMAFQIKCFKKFEEFQNQNKTILFVTHALDTVIRYCNRAIVIDNGKKIADTTPKDGVDIFKKILTGNYYNEDSVGKTEVNKNSSSKNLKVLIETNKDALIYGNKKVEIFDYVIFDEQDVPTNIISYNKNFKILFKIRFNSVIEDPIFAYTIKDIKGLEITGTNTYMKHIETGTFNEGDEIIVTFIQKANLQLGKYTLSLGCVNLNTSGIEVYSRLYDILFLDIIGSEQMVGFYDLNSKVEIVYNILD